MERPEKRLKSSPNGKPTVLSTTTTAHSCSTLFPPDEGSPAIHGRTRAMSEDLPLIRIDSFPLSFDEGSSFAHVPQWFIFRVLDCLEVPELLRLSAVSKSWGRQLDDESWWSSRFVNDLSQERFDALKMQEQSWCGWTIKQSLLWSLVVNLMTAHSVSASPRFEFQSKVWSGIMMERKRKHKKSALTAS